MQHTSDKSSQQLGVQVLGAIQASRKGEGRKIPPLNLREASGQTGAAAAPQVVRAETNQAPPVIGAQNLPNKVPVPQYSGEQVVHQERVSKRGRDKQEGVHQLKNVCLESDTRISDVRRKADEEIAQIKKNVEDAMLKLASMGLVARLTNGVWSFDRDPKHRVPATDGQFEEVSSKWFMQFGDFLNLPGDWQLVLCSMNDKLMRVDMKRARQECPNIPDQIKFAYLLNTIVKDKGKEGTAYLLPKSENGLNDGIIPYNFSLEDLRLPAAVKLLELGPTEEKVLLDDADPFAECVTPGRYDRCCAMETRDSSGGWSEALANMWNALMHALNGNGSEKVLHDIGDALISASALGPEVGLATIPMGIASHVAADVLQVHHGGGNASDLAATGAVTTALHTARAVYNNGSNLTAPAYNVENPLVDANNVGLSKDVGEFLDKHNARMWLANNHGGNMSNDMRKALIATLLSAESPEHYSQLGETVPNRLKALFYDNPGLAALVARRTEAKNVSAMSLAGGGTGEGGRIRSVVVRSQAGSLPIELGRCGMCRGKPVRPGFTFGEQGLNIGDTITFPDRLLGGSDAIAADIASAVKGESPQGTVPPHPKFLAALLISAVGIRSDANENYTLARTRIATDHRGCLQSMIPQGDINYTGMDLPIRSHPMGVAFDIANPGLALRAGNPLWKVFVHTSDVICAPGTSSEYSPWVAVSLSGVFSDIGVEADKGVTSQLMRIGRSALDFANGTADIICWSFSDRERRGVGLSYAVEMSRGLLNLNRFNGYYWDSSTPGLRNMCLNTMAVPPDVPPLNRVFFPYTTNSFYGVGAPPADDVLQFAMVTHTGFAMLLKGDAAIPVGTQQTWGRPSWGQRTAVVSVKSSQLDSASLLNYCSLFMEYPLFYDDTKQYAQEYWGNDYPNGFNGFPLVNVCQNVESVHIPGPQNILLVVTDIATRNFTSPVNLCTNLNGFGFAAPITCDVLNGMFVPLDLRSVIGAGPARYIDYFNDSMTGWNGAVNMLVQNGASSSDFTNASFLVSEFLNCYDLPDGINGNMQYGRMTVANTTGSPTNVYHANGGDTDSVLSSVGSRTTACGIAPDVGDPFADWFMGGPRNVVSTRGFRTMVTHYMRAGSPLGQHLLALGYLKVSDPMMEDDFTKYFFGWQQNSIRMSLVSDSVLCENGYPLWMRQTPDVYIMAPMQRFIRRFKDGFNASLAAAKIDVRFAFNTCSEIVYRGGDNNLLNVYYPFCSPARLHTAANTLISENFHNPCGPIFKTSMLPTFTRTPANGNQVVLLGNTADERKLLVEWFQGTGLYSVGANTLSPLTICDVGGVVDFATLVPVENGWSCWKYKPTYALANADCIVGKGVPPVIKPLVPTYMKRPGIYVFGVNLGMFGVSEGGVGVQILSSIYSAPAGGHVAPNPYNQEDEAWVESTVAVDFSQVGAVV